MRRENDYLFRIVMPYVRSFLFRYASPRSSQSHIQQLAANFIVGTYGEQQQLLLHSSIHMIIPPGTSGALHVHRTVSSLIRGRKICVVDRQGHGAVGGRVSCHLSQADAWVEAHVEYSRICFTGCM